jgi:uncharacterized membrane protein
VLGKNIIFIFFIIFLAASVQFAAAGDVATIHGAVYEWDSFSILENAIIEVNSTPSQSILAKYGVYSFSLAPGNYLISASYYNNNTLVSSAEEEITISDDGDYVLDLILLPTYLDSSFNGSEFSELEEIAALEDDTSNTWRYALAFISVCFMGIAAYFYFKGRGSTISTTSDISDSVTLYNAVAESGVVTSADSEYLSGTTVGGNQSLPDDLQNMLEIIESSGGRITQKDLRSKVKYSEAKVSLMVSDLEDRGLVHKFKKGRGNVIVLEDFE